MSSLDQLPWSHLHRKWEDRYKASKKRDVKDPWHEAGSPNYLEDKVIPDQLVVNKEASLAGD